MKKNLMTLAAVLCCATLFTSCDKINPDQPTAFTLSVSASIGDVATRALILSGSSIDATWVAGDRVTVYNVTQNAKLGGYLEAQTTGPCTTLEGTLTGSIKNGDKLTLMFLSPNYTFQDGTLEYIAANCDYSEATVIVTSISDTITTSDAEFVNQQAIVKFTLNNSSGTAISASTFVVEIGKNYYIVQPTQAASEIYVAIPGFIYKKVELFAKVGTNWYSYEKSGVSITDGQCYIMAVSMAQTGTLPGKFSVGERSTVRFSQGNLKYNGSFWSFHNNQYDHLHFWSPSDCDLFYWETEGNYGAEEKRSSLFGSNFDVVDWGVNAIRNGGNVANAYYTPNKNQWGYLFNNRRDAYGKYGAATVCGTNGIVVLPDNWTLPKGCSFTAGMRGGWSTNRYDATAWDKMEAAGAVFLPAAGYRDGTEICNGRNEGHYWSSSTDRTGLRAGQVIFGNSLYDGDFSRSAGRSVRLVRNTL